LQIAKRLVKKSGRKSVLLVNFEDYRWKNLNLDLLERIWNIFTQRIFEGEKRGVGEKSFTTESFSHEG
jgi:hypothetical protein